MRLTLRKRIGFSVILIILILISAGGTALAIKAAKEERSTASVLCEFAFRIALPYKDNRSEAKSLKLIESAGRKNADFTVPGIYKTLYGFDTVTLEQAEVCIFGEETASTFIYYLHGGAFVYQPNLFHYRYSRLLSEELKARVIMPIYPKAPQYTYQFTLDTVYHIYNEAVIGGEYDNIVIMGDSAGGSIALSLGQYITEKGGHLPDNIIAISPCLDMSLSNPELAQYKSLDPMLNDKDLKVKLGVYFDGQADLKDYKVSPIYCNYAIMPEVTIFGGSYDILTPDARLLKSMLDKQGIHINYFEYDKMAHTFPLFPIPEAKEALAQIKAVIYH